MATKKYINHLLSGMSPDSSEIYNQIDQKRIRTFRKNFDVEQLRKMHNITGEYTTLYKTKKDILEVEDQIKKLCSKLLLELDQNKPPCAYIDISLNERIMKSITEGKCFVDTINKLLPKGFSLKMSNKLEVELTFKVTDSLFSYAYDEVLGRNNNGDNI